MQGLLSYGAVILSFLGGIHWGVEITRSAASPEDGINATRLAISVVPSLAGWTALGLEARYGLALLAVAFVAHLLLDIRSTRQGLMPAWYSKLRTPLTTIVVVALIVALTEL